MENNYLFTSGRLGFRTWKNEDLPFLIRMNSDPDVMRYFPKIMDKDETKAMLTRLQNQYKLNGYTYFATEELQTRQLIGFVGLYYQDYVSDFTPAIDIGWRLLPTAWGKGYATEAAKRCLEYGSEDLKIDSIIAMCSMENKASENVMQKIGMSYIGEFDHPK